MKKFFSILCALAMVLSVSAVPFRKAPSKEAKKSVQFEQVRVQKQAKKATAEMRSFSNSKNAVVAPVKNAAVAKAKKEVVELNFDGDNASIIWQDYCDSYGWWQINATGEEYVVNLTNNASEEAAGEYAWDDMDASYCYVRPVNGSERIYFTDGSCTVTVDDETGNVLVAGTFVGADENTYEISIAYAPTPIESAEINFTEPMDEPYFYSDGSVELTAEEGIYSVLLCYYVHDAGSAVGEYNTEDFDLDWSYIYVGNTKLSFTAAHAVVTEEDGLIQVAAEVTTEGDYEFVITMFYQKPDDPVKEAEYALTATNLEVNDSYAAWFGTIILTASDENVSVELYVDGDEAGAAIAGDYVIGENSSAYFESEAGEFAAFSGNFSIAYEDGNYQVNGVILAWDNVEYTLDLSRVIPPVSREEDITIEGLEMTLYDFGAWQVAGYNEDSTKYVSLAAYTEEVAGTYTEAELAEAAAYCYVVTDITDESYKFFEMISANITVAVNGDDVTITGTFIGFDGTETVQFNLSLKATATEAEDTEHPGDQEVDFIHNFAEYEVDDSNLEDWGSLYVQAMDDDLNYIILDITLPAGAQDLVAGEYPILGSYDEQSVYAGKFNSTYGYIPSFAAILVEEEGQLYYGEEFWWLAEGTITIDEEAVITVDAVNTKGAKIKVVLGATEGIENTEAAVKAVKVVRDGQLIIIKNGVEFNAQGAVIK